MRAEKVLDNTTLDENFKADLINDYHKADISDLNKSILEYVEKLTLEPASTRQEDIDKLKSDGCSERMIHDIAQVASYFNYINRLADGLGVELEDEYS